MSINLRITTEIRNTLFAGNGRIAINVLVNDINVMVWHQTRDSIGAEPKFTARAEFGSGEFRVFTPEYDWTAEFVGDEKAPQLEVSIGHLPSAIATAVDKMFHGASRLQIERNEYGYEVNMDGQHVLQWWQDEYGKPFECHSDYFCRDGGEDEAEVDDIDSWTCLMEENGRFQFAFASDGVSDVWDEQYIEDITAHAYRALREEWVRW